MERPPRCEVFWTCACGTKVKAILDMSKASATVQCPDPSCKARRTIPGQITRLWVETERGAWRGVDLVNWLTYPEEGG